MKGGWRSGAYVFWSVVFIVLLLAQSSQAVCRSSKSLSLENISHVSRLLIPFIENCGQVNSQVRYYANTFAGTVFLTKTGKIVYSLPSHKGGISLSEELLNTKVIRVSAHGLSSTKVNYFIGNKGSGWYSRLRTYNYVSLGQVYPGITLDIRAHANNVEKLFYIAPGANPADIHIKLQGAQKLCVDNSGRLEAMTARGRVKFTRPVAFQKIDGKKRYVPVSYEVKNNTYSFRLGSYNKNKQLVIDPLLGSTFLGGSSWDDITAMAVNPVSGNVYVTGTTESAGFPTTTGAVDASLNSTEVFISELNGNLTQLVASTFLGGNNEEVAKAIAINATSGNIYVAGWTSSSNFPVNPPAFWGGRMSGVVASVIPLNSSYDSTFEGSKMGFVSELSGNLTELIGSTFLGGNGTDTISSMVLDSSGNVYVAGSTSSPNFPTTTGAYDISLNGTQDGFVSELGPNLTYLYASTYIGGNSTDSISCLKINNSGVYVTGKTSSEDFPVTAGAYSSVLSGNHTSDAFVAKLDPALDTLMAATYLGGKGDEAATSMALAPNGEVYITGWTSSENFPTVAAANSKYSGYDDAFVSEFDGNLTQLLGSTYVGGRFEDGAFAIAVNSADSVYIAGVTGSKNFPITSSSYDLSLNGTEDAFICNLSGNLSRVIQITYLGGSEDDWANSLVFDTSGNIYVAGWTCSSDFPVTTGAYDVTFNGTDYLPDAFITKLDPGLADPPRYVSKSVTDPPADNASSSGGGGGGCSMNPAAGFSPTLILMLVCPVIVLFIKRYEWFQRNR